MPKNPKRKTKAEVTAAADRAEARSKTTKKADAVKAKLDTTERPYTGARMIAENDLRNLLKSVKSLEGDKDETVGMIREKIGYAVEKKNLNKNAFAMIRKFDRLEAEKLADLWDTLEAYMDMAGLTERIKSVARLPLPEPGEQSDEPMEAQEPAPPAETVSRPRLVDVSWDTPEKIPA